MATHATGNEQTLLTKLNTETWDYSTIIKKESNRAGYTSNQTTTQVLTKTPVCQTSEEKETKVMIITQSIVSPI